MVSNIRDNEYLNNVWIGKRLQQVNMDNINDNSHTFHICETQFTFLDLRIIAPSSAKL